MSVKGDRERWYTRSLEDAKFRISIWITNFYSLMRISACYKWNFDLSRCWSAMNIITERHILWSIHLWLILRSYCYSPVHITAITRKLMCSPLRWRLNEPDGVPNHQRHDGLLNCLFRRKSKKTSKLRVNGLWVSLCERNSQGTSQRPSNAENVSICLHEGHHWFQRWFPKDIALHLCKLFWTHLFNFCGPNSADIDRKNKCDKYHCPFIC